MIAILGGSFNPPHLGHGQICRYVLENSLAGEVWVIPCFKHPFGKELAPYEDRFKMCELAFKALGKNVKVLAVEKELGGFSYTITTLTHLKKKFPKEEFALIVGGDVSNETGEWKDFEDIKKLARIINIPRGQGSPILDVSSTEIRSDIKNNKDVSAKIEHVVWDHIRSNRLYI